MARGIHMRAIGSSLAAALVLAGLLTGCLFEPREAESPGDNTVVYLSRGQADNILENVQKAMSNLEIGGYEDAIGSEFRADDVNLSEFDESTWDRAQEINFVTWLFSNNRKIVMNMFAEEPISNQIEGNHVEFTVTYAMEVTSNASQVKKYRATALVDVKLSGSFWYVERWVDQIGEVDPDTGIQLETMGSLRAAFVSK